MGISHATRKAPWRCAQATFSLVWIGRGALAKPALLHLSQWASLISSQEAFHQPLVEPIHADRPSPLGATWHLIQPKEQGQQSRGDILSTSHAILTVHVARG